MRYTGRCRGRDVHVENPLAQNAPSGPSAMQNTGSASPHLPPADTAAEYVAISDRKLPSPSANAIATSRARRASSAAKSRTH